MNEIALRVESMYQDGEIDETVKLYFIDKTCKTARFYLLPKYINRSHCHQVDQWWRA